MGAQFQWKPEWKGPPGGPGPLQYGGFRPLGKGYAGLEGRWMSLVPTQHASQPTLEVEKMALGHESF